MQFIKVLNVKTYHDWSYFPGWVLLTSASLVLGVGREAMWDLSLFERNVKWNIFDSRKSSSTLETGQEQMSLGQSLVRDPIPSCYFFAYSFSHWTCFLFFFPFCKQSPIYCMWPGRLVFMFTFSVTTLLCNWGRTTLQVVYPGFVHISLGKHRWALGKMAFIKWFALLCAL